MYGASNIVASNVSCVENFTANPHPKDSPYKIVLFLGMFSSDKKFIAACPSL